MRCKKMTLIKNIFFELIHDFLYIDHSSNHIYEINAKEHKLISCIDIFCLLLYIEKIIESGEKLTSN